MNALIEFTVGNFRSFRARRTFTFVADTRLSSKVKRLDEENLFSVDEDLWLLRSAAIYGANASGKSNLITALRFMRTLVLGSSKETVAAEPIRVEPFRLAESQTTEPSYFEIVFLADDTMYRYGFEVDTERVHAEWLFTRPGKKEARLFAREGDNIATSRSFKEGRDLESKTRKNALFLSVVAQFNGTISKRLQSWFSDTLKIISGLNDEGYRHFTIGRCEDEVARRDIVAFVRELDVGIHDIAVRKQPSKVAFSSVVPEEVREFILKHSEPEVKSISTIHRRLDSDGKELGLEVFDIEQHESEGTKKVFALGGPILDTLANGRVLAIDELDARLHPLITAALIRLFNGSATNRHNAQLLFTTHDTSLLTNDLLRRDQIWFTEKDRSGATDLYSLLEYKVRNDAALAKSYIQGRYGAIPFLGDLSALLSGSDGKET